MNTHFYTLTQSTVQHKGTTKKNWKYRLPKLRKSELNNIIIMKTICYLERMCILYAHPVHSYFQLFAWNRGLLISPRMIWIKFIEHFYMAVIWQKRRIINPELYANFLSLCMCVSICSWSFLSQFNWRRKKNTEKNITKDRVRKRRENISQTFCA